MLWPASPDDFCAEGGGKKSATSFSACISCNVAHQCWPSLPLKHTRAHTRGISSVAGSCGLMHCPGCSEVGGHESLEGMCGGQSQDCGV